MFKSMTSRIVSGGALALVASVAVGVAIAQDDQTAVEQEPSMLIGTLNPETVLQQYHRVSELMTLQQELEPQAQEAIEAGDQQRLMALQQQMQQAQMAIVQEFEAKMDEIVPVVAREHNLKVVAVQVVFNEDDVETQDLTEQLIEAINADAPEAEAPVLTDPDAQGDQDDQPEPSDDPQPQGEDDPPSP